MTQLFPIAILLVITWKSARIYCGCVQPLLRDQVFYRSSVAAANSKTNYFQHSVFETMKIC